MRNTSGTPKRTGRVKQLENMQRGYKPLNMVPTPSQSRTMIASQSREPRDVNSGSHREYGTDVRQTDPQVTFVDRARAASARVANELREHEDIMEIHSDHSSEEESVVSGQAQTQAQVKHKPVSSDSPNSSYMPASGSSSSRNSTSISPSLASTSPLLRCTGPLESTAKKIEGFGHPYKPRLSSLSKPIPRTMGSSENVFQSVTKVSGLPSKVVDRMRPKGSSGQPAGLGDAHSSDAKLGASILQNSNVNPDDIISVLRSSPQKQPAATLRRQSVDRGKRPYSTLGRRDSNPKQPNQSIPMKKLSLLGVQIGKFVQLTDEYATTSSIAELHVCIRYLQRGIDINGLRDGKEQMKISRSDFAAIEYRMRDGLVVLRIIPTETAESIFGTDIFDPESADPSYKDIFLCFRLQSKNEESIISRLVAVFKEDIRILTLDTEVYRKYAQELSKPPVVDIVSASDEEGPASTVQKRGMSMSATSAASLPDAVKATTATTSSYWSSIGSGGRSNASVQSGLRTGGEELTWNDPALYSKRKPPNTLFGSGEEPGQNLRLQRYKLRKTKAGEPAGSTLGAACDDDDDDFVSQCREFRWDDHSLHFRYPHNGPKPIAVTGSDICRLYKGEFLNDTILEFYVRYIDENLRISNPLLHKQCFFFNTFFFRKLSHRNKAAPVNSDSNPMDAVHKQLQKWTASVELFEKQYIFVPINENTHWYLAIIANSDILLSEAKNTAADTLQSEPSLKRVDSDDDAKSTIDTGLIVDDAVDNTEPAVKLEKPDNDDWDVPLPAPDTIDLSGVGNMQSTEPVSPLAAANTRSKSAMVPIEFNGKMFEIPEAKYLDPTSTPAIIILDSLGNRHQQTYGLLRGYMRAEAKSRHGVDLTEAVQVGKYAKVPLQNNFCDCGVYLLHYIEEFLKDPVAFLALVLNGINARKMFATGEMEQKRLDILGLATSLTHEHKRLSTAQPAPGPEDAAEINDKDDPSEPVNDSDTRSDTSKITSLLSEVMSEIPNVSNSTDAPAPLSE
ncbi:hypothetical protein IW147_004796 [Coemansia sp. RSA 720]|nr:hypothetical protein IW147_004796 [Coemansia sp. RSA 720]